MALLAVKVVDLGKQPLWSSLLSLPRDGPNLLSPFKVSAFLSSPHL